MLWLFFPSDLILRHCTAAYSSNRTNNFQLSLLEKQTSRKDKKQTYSNIQIRKPLLLLPPAGLSVTINLLSPISDRGSPSPPVVHSSFLNWPCASNQPPHSCLHSICVTLSYKTLTLCLFTAARRSPSWQQPLPVGPFFQSGFKPFLKNHPLLCYKQWPLTHSLMRKASYHLCSVIKHECMTFSEFKSTKNCYCRSNQKHNWVVRGL